MDAALMSSDPVLLAACCERNATSAGPMGDQTACLLAQSGMVAPVSDAALRAYHAQYQEPARSRCSNPAYVKHSPWDCCHTYDRQSLGQLGLRDEVTGALCSIARM